MTPGCAPARCVEGEPHDARVDQPAVDGGDRAGVVDDHGGGHRQHPVGAGAGGLGSGVDVLDDVGEVGERPRLHAAGGAAGGGEQQDAAALLLTAGGRASAAVAPGAQQRCRDGEHGDGEQHRDQALAHGRRAVKPGRPRRASW